MKSNLTRMERHQTGGKSQATKQLDASFEEADILIENMDAVIGIIMTGQPNFYNGYKSARKVVVTGSGKLALKATAVEIPGEKPLKGAKFTFKQDSEIMAGKPGNGEIMKKTSEKGSFKIKNMPKGTYQVKVTKTGYKEKEVTISVASGEMAELKVELEKA